LGLEALSGTISAFVKVKWCIFACTKTYKHKIFSWKGLKKQWRLFKLESPRFYLIGKAPDGAKTTKPKAGIPVYKAVAPVKLNLKVNNKSAAKVKKPKKKSAKKAAKKASRKLKRDNRKAQRAAKKRASAAKKARVKACKKRCGRANPLSRKGRKAIKCRKRCK